MMHFSDQEIFFESNEIFCESYSLSIENGFEKNQCMDISNSDSNYVSEESTVCSEGFSDIKDEDDKKYSLVYNNHQDMEDLIELNSIIKNSEDRFLLEMPNIIFDSELNLTFDTIKFSVYISDVYNLLNSLTHSIATYNTGDFNSLSPIKFNENIHITTSTPMTQKTTHIQPVEAALNCTILNNQHNQTYTKGTCSDNTFALNAEKCIRSSLKTPETNRSIPFEAKNRFSMIQTTRNSFELDEDSVDSSAFDNTITKAIPCENLSDIPESPLKVNEAVRIRTVIPFSKNRRSMIQTTVKLRPPVIQTSTNNLSVKTESKNIDQLNSNVTLEKQNIRKSNLIKPKEVNVDQRKSIRYSMASIPQYSNPVKVVAQKQQLVVPQKIKKPEIVNLPSKAATTQKSGLIPKSENEVQSRLLRPSQLKFSNKNPLIQPPKPSESIPIVSPNASVDDNPLSRTFDKQEFLLLKSVTNIEDASLTVSANDTINNNDNTVYKIAQREETNLINDTSSTIDRPKSTVNRGLRIPSKIQSRVIPSQKR